jgi:hypothetical protein
MRASVELVAIPSRTPYSTSKFKLEDTMADEMGALGELICRLNPYTKRKNGSSLFGVG